VARPRLPSALDDALAFNLDRVASFFRHELMVALADYDLTPEQWQLMSVLWANEAGLSQQAMTDLLAKDKHNISRMIRRLEAKG
jgi:DNA-binding MarR family transcriptional regulator